MKKFANYWTRTETYESLWDYIIMNYDGLKDSIVTMIAGGRYRVNPLKFQNDSLSFQCKDDILTLLIHLGYLAYDGIKQERKYIFRTKRFEESSVIRWKRLDGIR